VVTSGGIGPTHDDITYSSISKAFNLPLVLEPETYARLRQFSKKKIEDWDADTTEVRAKKKMAILPLDRSRKIKDEQIYFSHNEAMTPLVVVNGNVHILPGVSFLFRSMLEAYEPVLKTKLAKPKQKVYRIVIETPMGESEVAGYLEALAERVKSKGVKVGSYPTLDERPNTVDLVGTDCDFMESLVEEVVKEVKGKRRGQKGDTTDKNESS
jgi:molybdopterin-biosynthesis enzyme MoeA-like protein